MTYRTKNRHTNALERPYVRRPINDLNLSRPEPSCIETGFTRPTGRDRAGAVQQLRALALVLLPVSMIACAISLISLRPIAFLVSLALAAAGYLLVLVTSRRLR